MIEMLDSGPTRKPPESLSLKIFGPEDLSPGFFQETLNLNINIKHIVCSGALRNFLAIFKS